MTSVKNIGPRILVRMQRKEAHQENNSAEPVKTRGISSKPEKSRQNQRNLVKTREISRNLVKTLLKPAQSRKTRRISPLVLDSAHPPRRQRVEGVCQHTSAYVSIRQHTSAYVSILQHTSAYVSIRQGVEGVCRNLCI